ncbi:4-phosphoerythronate dehydrogenase PdxB [Dysgonomonas sp. 216]|uniref:4-phosphoerythronate dehydrogenase PdxB n=1 Tax=Dysgonomonas sp. 216 TaxID=2302934 RepID=UPI0013D3A3B0|nr:4-phosphoerythronate dehydrogenase PdxB [Dysgonomonas sp. 216]NDW18194.1 4-phosphoerythronate dehydrogenase PdxB [Dysgonomonas sp. 216]
MKIVADKNIPYLKGIAEIFGDVTYISGSDMSQNTLKEADTIIVRTVTYLDKDVLENTNVKLICTATIGFDHIDTVYCAENGIRWYNAPGCNSGSVMQYIVSSLFVIAEKKGINLKEKTIGIVGVGNVGKKVARACSLLGMRVLLNDPPRQETEQSNEFVDIETIKKEADIITFHTPLTKEGRYKTLHLADDDFFNTLTKKPIIINSARGGIIDTNAIKHAIKAEKISGAIIDCWEKEPNIDTEYMHMVDIATPHIAGYSADGKANATRISLENLAHFWNLPTKGIDKVTPPEIDNSSIDLRGVAPVEQVSYAALKTYNPLADQTKLLANPSAFSTLRGEYPIRREYNAYTLENADKTSENVLSELGFKNVRLNKE